ncbi:unnamed protein product, partial [Amoebophrya sp. A25]
QSSGPGSSTSEPTTTVNRGARASTSSSSESSDKTGESSDYTEASTVRWSIASSSGSTGVVEVAAQPQVAVPCPEGGASDENKTGGHGAIINLTTSSGADGAGAGTTNIKDSSSVTTSKPVRTTVASTSSSSTSATQRSSASSRSRLSSTYFTEAPKERLKLIDFGFSKRLTPTGDEVLRLPCGTLHYASPDVLKKKYNRKCDTWSMGVIAFMLLTGAPPFTGSTNQSVIEKIRSGRIRFNSRWAPLSPAAKDFVVRLLEVDSERRLSGEEALQHEFLRRSFHRQSVDALRDRFPGLL